MSTSNTNNKKSNSNDNNSNKVRSSTKRPRAPIACFRCHHKKVRCDGAHPNCTRCLTTGILCAYPSSRRSRTTQPANVDPFIDNLSHLEARIRRIESDLENQRSMVHSIVASPSSTSFNENGDVVNDLSSKMLKTEMEVQDSRSILAQLRLRGEQRISRGKRAAAQAQQQQQAVANNTLSVSSSMPIPSSSTKEDKVKNNSRLQQSNMKSSTSSNKRVKQQQQLNRSSSNSCDKTATPTSVAAAAQVAATAIYPTNNSFYFQGMMLDNNTDLNSVYDNNGPPGHGMDWTLFDHQHHHQQHENMFNNTPILNGGGHLIFPDNNTKMMMDISPVSTRSSSLASTNSQLMGNFPSTVMLQPSNSTTSNTSNATSCSSLSSCDTAIFGFSMVDDMMLQHHTAAAVVGGNEQTPSSQDVHMLSNNPSVWYYPS